LGGLKNGPPFLNAYSDVIDRQRDYLILHISLKCVILNPERVMLNLVQHLFRTCLVQNLIVQDRCPSPSTLD